MVPPRNSPAPGDGNSARVTRKSSAVAAANLLSHSSALKSRKAGAQISGTVSKHVRRPSSADGASENLNTPAAAASFRRTALSHDSKAPSDAFVAASSPLPPGFDILQVSLNKQAAGMSDPFIFSTVEVLPSDWAVQNQPMDGAAQNLHIDGATAAGVETLDGGVRNNPSGRGLVDKVDDPVFAERVNTSDTGDKSKCADLAGRVPRPPTGSNRVVLDPTAPGSNRVAQDPTPTTHLRVDSAALHADAALQENCSQQQDSGQQRVSGQHRDLREKLNKLHEASGQQRTSGRHQDLREQHIHSNGTSSQQNPSGQHRDFHEILHGTSGTQRDPGTHRDFSDKLKQPPIRHVQTSFASVAASSVRTPDVFASGFTAIRPVKLGNFVSISIPEAIYQEQLNAFRFSVIGRTIFRKGDKPLPPAAIKSELDALLQPTAPWSLITMGRGFFTMKFTCEEDMRRVSRVSSIRLSIGIVHVRDWTPDFDPFKEQSSIALIWVKTFLPAFYWHPEVLTGILSAAGNVIKLDGITMSGTVGQFARALVEVDLAQPLVESVMIGCGANSFFADLAYENLPPFCPLCKLVGHSLDKCRRNVQNCDSAAFQEDKANQKSGNTANVVDKGAQENNNSDWKPPRCHRRNKKQTRTVADNSVVTTIETNNGFAALDNEAEPPKAIDILERMTVPVTEDNSVARELVSVKAHPASNESSNALTQELESIERQLQNSKSRTDSVVSRVAGESSRTVTFDQSSAMVIVGRGYDELKDNRDFSAEEANRGLRIVQDKLRQASALGAKPTVSVVDDTSRLSSLDMVAGRSWADEMEEWVETDTEY